MSKARSIRFLMPAVAVVLLGALPSPMKDMVGAFALIDRVVFEPNAERPERVQLWGVFALANTFDLVGDEIESIELDRFHPVQRGYMYFQVNTLNPANTRAEWAEIAKFAGTGQPIAFGSRIPPPETYSVDPDVDPTAIRIDPSDPSTIHWIVGYNGRVRSARAPATAPDTFPATRSWRGVAGGRHTWRGLPAVLGGRADVT